MTTSTELLRAAEHMRLRAVELHGESNGPDMRLALGVVYGLEREAKRLQAIETQRVAHFVDPCSRAPLCASHMMVGHVVATHESLVTCDGCMIVLAQRPKRSWPEGWPPFSVLRRAYESLGVHHNPSTMWCERRGGRMGQADARDVRVKWSKALLDHSSP